MQYSLRTAMTICGSRRLRLASRIAPDWPIMIRALGPQAAAIARSNRHDVCRSSQSAGRKTGEIKLHGPEAFEGMRKAGRLTAEALDLLVDARAARASPPRRSTSSSSTSPWTMAPIPAPLIYRGYRSRICTSINHVVCHGIPDDKPLRDGDIVNIDVTLILDGWHGDSSRMYLVGEVPRRAAAPGRGHL